MKKMVLVLAGAMLVAMMIAPATAQAGDCLRLQLKDGSCGTCPSV